MQSIGALGQVLTASLGVVALSLAMTRPKPRSCAVKAVIKSIVPRSSAFWAASLGVAMRNLHVITRVVITPAVPAAAFAQAAASMTMSTGPSIVTGGDGAVGATGLAAVDLFAEDLARWPGIFPDDVLDLVLQGLSAFVEKAGTGGGLFRRLLSSGAADIARLTGDARASEVASAAHRCAERWSLVAALARQDGLAPARAEQAALAAAALPPLERDLVRALETAGASQDLRTGV